MLFAVNVLLRTLIPPEFLITRVAPKLPSPESVKVASPLNVVVKVLLKLSPDLPLME